MLELAPLDCARYHGRAPSMAHGWAIIKGYPAVARLDRLLGSRDSDPFEVTLLRSRPFRGMGVREGLGAYEEVDQLFSAAARRVPRGVAIPGRVAAWHAGTSAPGRIDCEALLIVDDGCPQARVFAAQEVASTVYQGDAWHGAYARLTQWLADHRYELAGPKFAYLLPGGLVLGRLLVRGRPARLLRGPAGCGGARAAPARQPRSQRVAACTRRTPGGADPRA